METTSAASTESVFFLFFFLLANQYKSVVLGDTSGTEKNKGRPRSISAIRLGSFSVQREVHGTIAN